MLGGGGMVRGNGWGGGGNRWINEKGRREKKRFRNGLSVMQGKKPNPYEIVISLKVGEKKPPCAETKKKPNIFPQNPIQGRYYITPNSPTSDPLPPKTRGKKKIYTFSPLTIFPTTTSNGSTPGNPSAPFITNPLSA